METKINLPNPANFDHFQESDRRIVVEEHNEYEEAAASWDELAKEMRIDNEDLEEEWITERVDALRAWYREDCKERIASATWHFDSAATPEDPLAVACVLRDEEGEELAACLYSNGEMDLESEYCGVFLCDVSTDTIDWPDEKTAMKAVWDNETSTGECYE